MHIQIKAGFADWYKRTYGVAPKLRDGDFGEVTDVSFTSVFVVVIERNQIRDGNVPKEYIESVYHESRT